MEVSREIYETERQYNKYLRTLVDIFIPRLGANSSFSILSQRDIKKVFANVAQLYAFSQQFLRDVEEIVAKEGKGVEKIYESFSPYFKIYGDYCDSHQEGSDHIANLIGKDEAIRLAVEECEDLAALMTGKRQTILSLLIMPIQRVPRHLLLLRELQKHSSTPHSFTKALASMEESARHINERIRQRENAVKVWEIQNSLIFDGEKKTFDVLNGNRRFIKEGLLMKVCRRSVKKTMFFLFNDCLIYARESALVRRRRRWKFKFKVIVRDVEDIPDGSKQANQQPHAFLVKAEPKSFVCICESESEKQAWIDALLLVISEPTDINYDDLPDTTENSASSPNPSQEATEDDDDTTKRALYCEGCKAKFSLFSGRRRHRCPLCEQIYCGRCCSFRQIVEHGDGNNTEGKRPGRICNACVLQAPTKDDGILRQRRKLLLEQQTKLQQDRHKGSPAHAPCNNHRDERHARTLFQMLNNRFTLLAIAFILALIGAGIAYFVFRFRVEPKPSSPGIKWNYP